jgi:hypothetical protein
MKPPQGSSIVIDVLMIDDWFQMVAPYWEPYALWLLSCVVTKIFSIVLDLGYCTWMSCRRHDRMWLIWRVFEENLAINFKNSYHHGAYANLEENVLRRVARRHLTRKSIASTDLP